MYSVEFQFPTGWNSTNLMTKISKKMVVSIPNGMEFYWEFIVFFNKFTSFQFPTGWNSTQGTSRILAGDEVCFNSQRDGILLNGRAITHRRVILFQFPTGWNSTGGSSNYHSKFRAFQFPTGWNSTLRSLIRMALVIVSIPNGMEFYHVYGRAIASFEAFQFPTGWNSTIVA